jgi:hypothetical protein
VFSQKVGVLPEKMFTALLNDRLVAKGTVLEFITNLFKVRRLQGGCRWPAPRRAQGRG